MRTRSWHVAAAVLLVVLLAVVATLQYRWVGDVSAAERDRLQASLRSRVSEFTMAVDADVTRAFAAFEIDAAGFDANASAAVSEAVDRAARESITGTAVKAVFVVESAGPGTVRRWDKASATLLPVEWPAELESVRRRLQSTPPIAVAGLPLPPGFVGDGLDGEAPALIVPLVPKDTPLPSPPDQPGAHRFRMTALPLPAQWRAVVVWLDPERLGSRLIAPLVARHFGEPGSSDFNVTVVSRADGQSLFRSGAADVDQKSADRAADVFAIAPGNLRWTRTAAPPSAVADPSRNVTDRLAITIVRRASPGPNASEKESGDAASGVVRGAGSSDDVRGGGSSDPTVTPAWRVLVQARRGSLDAIVARSRLRNLTVSMAVLGILAASFALILVASAREQWLARQQLEFVASVSHELRTPLAVIRSAGENLADGVVSGEQVANYGVLIRNEGRRLSDMVERVMDFAGMTSGAAGGSTHPVDVVALVEETVGAAQADAAEREVVMRVRSGDTRAMVNADADALRSALQNAVGNALKYSDAGGVVEVDVAVTAHRLRISVSDRGIGIDAEDIPHVFKPFFRGRRAVASQVRGSGVGLSVVHKVVAAHGGEVHIASRDGGGTSLEIELPVMPAPDTVSA